MGTKHRDIGKSDASLHRFAYWSETDPAVTHGTGTGGVEAGQGWIEHESGDPDAVVDVKIRNNANDGWVSILVKNPDHTHDGEDILVPETDQTGTSYTLALTDAGDMVTLTNASAITVTVPPNSSVAFPVGTQVMIRQGGAGQVSIQGGSGVTVEAAGGKEVTVEQYSVAALVKTGTDEWSLFGDLEASS